jgi:hypothetical protein
LKCAHAFQCEGLPNNHTSLKLSKKIATLHTQKKENKNKKINTDIDRFVLNTKII